MDRSRRTLKRSTIRWPIPTYHINDKNPFTNTTDTFPSKTTRQKFIIQQLTPPLQNEFSSFQVARGVEEAAFLRFSTSNYWSHFRYSLSTVHVLPFWRALVPIAPLFTPSTLTFSTYNRWLSCKYWKKCRFFTQNTMYQFVAFLLLPASRCK